MCLKLKMKTLQLCSYSAGCSHDTRLCFCRFVRVSRDGSLVGRPRFYSQQSQEELFSPQWPDRHWDRAMLLTEGYWGLFPRGIKRSGREADHSPPSIVKSKNGRAIPELPHKSWRTTRRYIPHDWTLWRLVALVCVWIFHFILFNSHADAFMWICLIMSDLAWLPSYDFSCVWT
jgi:hypothetical protein